MKTKLAIASIFMGCATQAFAAAPLGLEIGTASCSQARQVLGASSDKALGNDVLLTATRPGDVFPGATSLLVRCSEERVIFVQLEMSKGGMGNGNAQETYATLKKKYQLAAGGPMPALGNGYARFVSGNTVIEQDAPHLSFEFSVAYYAKPFYERLVKRKQDRNVEIRNVKEKSL